MEVYFFHGIVLYVFILFHFDQLFFPTPVLLMKSGLRLRDFFSHGEVVLHFGLVGDETGLELVALNIQ